MQGFLSAYRYMKQRSPATSPVEAPSSRFIFGSRAVRFADREAQEDSDWDIISSVGAWEDVIAGRQNLSVAFRSGHLRYCDRDEAGSGTAGSRQSLTRLRVLADLLGLTGW